MYAIRVDDQRKLLHVGLSGRMTTNETLRAVSQAAALAEAGNISAVLCDATRVERGPAGLLLIAAAISAGYRPGMRVALFGSVGQLPLFTRIARFSGLRHAIATFATAADAECWLASHARRPQRTPRQHAEALLGRSLLIEATAAATTSSAPPAA
ncbi:MAG: hypothetical protein M0R74_14705 [Dehalococcoidia bacterium]|nr:hypothetical protein [Dehalococcoidia bacterium]